MKEYILSEKAQKAFNEYIAKCFWIYDYTFRVDTYFNLGITCLFCGKKTDNKYYILYVDDFSNIEICIECFKKEITIIESEKK